MAEAIFQKGLAYRDFTPAHTGDSEKSGAQGTWLFNPGMRELSREESDRRAAAGEPFALRFRVPRDGAQRRALHRCRLRRASESRRRHRRLRAAALRRHADLSPGLVRRRRRSAHQPHHPRPGSSHQHLQARADLRGRRLRRRRSSRICRCWSRPTAPSSPSAATVRSSASPPIATPDFCPKPSSIFSACSAGRPRTIASIWRCEELDRRLLARRHQSLQCGGELQGATAPQLRKTRSIRRPSGSTPSTSAPCPSTT